MAVLGRVHMFYIPFGVIPFGGSGSFWFLNQHLGSPVTQLCLGFRAVDPGPLSQSPLRVSLIPWGGPRGVPCFIMFVLDPSPQSPLRVSSIPLGGPRGDPCFSF